jgi:hypothetical protein
LTFRWATPSGIDETPNLEPPSTRRKTGEITARRQRHGPLPKLAPYSDLLRNRVRAVPDTTIDEMRVWLLSEHKIKVGNTCVWKQLGRVGLH